MCSVSTLTVIFLNDRMERERTLFLQTGYVFYTALLHLAKLFTTIPYLSLPDGNVPEVKFEDPLRFFSECVPCPRNAHDFLNFPG